LQTEGERALFAELKRWDTGGAVRAAVVASLPVLEDGALQRRLSDALLVVPEGLALLRVVEVPRQSGVVTARAEGPWTIGPGSGPGEVLQLAGGGSTPLDGLMRAGMDAAVKLRKAGLEPGRIARLTVLVGDLSGLEPADGDLGEGDQVALLEPRSLLLGIARASTYAGTDNPKLWTTADVRAALESLSLAGRVPTVEELNGEGFAYSPYVLRRPELLATVGAAGAPAQAAMAPAHASVAAPPAPPPVAYVPPAPAVPPPSPVAYVPPAPAVPQPFRDTMDVTAAGRPDTGNSGGLGGLFAGGEPDDAGAPPPPGAPSTSVFPGPGESDPAWSGPRLLDQRMVEDGPGRGGPPKAVWLVAAALVLVVLVAVGGLLLLRGSPSSGPAAASASHSAAAPADQLPVGTVQAINGVSFTVQASRVDKTCIGHAYGAVAQSFTTNDCAGLARALYSAQVDGKPAVVAVSRVHMRDNAGAAALKTLADRDGTGNVSDLLREGVRYTGGPDRLAGSQYASSVDGSTVTIVETASAGPAAVSASRLKTLAGSGLVLPMPDPTK
jgi:hypothetical protein